MSQKTFLPLSYALLKLEYTERREKFVAFLERKHESLKKYAQKDTASEFAIKKENAELDECYDYLEDVEITIKKMEDTVRALRIENKILLTLKTLNHGI